MCACPLACMCVYLCIHMSLCLSVYLCVYVSWCVCVCMSLYVWCLCVYVSLYLCRGAYVSVCISVCASLYVYVFVYMCTCVCVYASLFICVEGDTQVCQSWAEAEVRGWIRCVPVSPFTTNPSCSLTQGWPVTLYVDQVGLKLTGIHLPCICLLYAGLTGTYHHALPPYLLKQNFSHWIWYLLSRLAGQ